MRVLFITGDSNPFNTFRGSNIRSYYIAKSLSQLGVLDIISFKSPGYKEIDNRIRLPINKIYYIQKNSLKSNTLKALLVNNAKGFKILRLFEILFKTDPFYKHDNAIKKEVQSIIQKEEYDIIVIQRLETAILAGLEKEKNIIVDIDDHPVDSISSRYLNKYLILRLIAKYKIKKAYNKYNVNIPKVFLSNKNQIKKTNECFLPNLPFVEEVKAVNKTFITCDNNLLFIGALGYSPNYLGLKRFLNNIFPIIKKEIPDCCVVIIGKGLPAELEREFSLIEGVKLMGFVENTTTYFQNSKVYISPIYSGAGTNIKILEAIEKQIPIVASTFSVRGYEEFLEDQKNIMIASSDYDFAQKAIILLKNEKLRSLISKSAYTDLKRQCYNYDNFFEIIKNTIDDVLKRLD